MLLILNLFPFYLKQNLELSEKYIDVSLVQVNQPISYKLVLSNRRKIRQNYLSISKQAIFKSSPDLIIWPETITASDNTKQFIFMTELITLSKNNDTAFIFGTPRKHSQKYYNSAAFLYKDTLHFYDKINLMPFGEYWPWKAIFRFFNLSNIIPGSEFSKGSSIKSFSLNEVEIGTGICLETTTPYFYREYAKNNVNVLVSLVNNAWFKTSSIAKRQLQMLQIRAVEVGLPILQSSNMGFTCAVGPTGKVIRSIKQFEETFITYRCYLNSIETYYRKVGNIILSISFIFLFFNIALLKRLD